MAIPVKLPVFEGPLDLLMHLIEKNKIDIYDIPIVEITDQYLEYVRQMDRQDLDVTSEFLVMAATLLDIKCRMLLPREKDEETGEEEGDPREELVRRLLEYKMYKYLSEELAVYREQAGVRYFREQKLPREVLNYRPPINYDELLKGTDLESLQKVFGEVLRRKKSRRDPIRSGFGKIKREEISIDSKTLYIRAYLQAHPHTDFRALLESQESREEVIVTFLILLELMKTQKVHIIQDTICGKILVEAGASAEEESVEENAEPENTEPEVADPDNTKPEVADPDNTKPEDADPDNTEPEDADPDNTEPEDADLDNTEPEDADLEIIAQAEKPTEKYSAEVENREVPVETQTVEEDAQTVPAETQAAEEDAQIVPAETQAAEEDAQTVPAETQAAEEDAQTVPAETQAAEEDAQTVPAETQAAEEKSDAVEIGGNDSGAAAIGAGHSDSMDDDCEVQTEAQSATEEGEEYSHADALEAGPADVPEDYEESSESSETNVSVNMPLTFYQRAEIVASPYTSEEISVTAENSSREEAVTAEIAENSFPDETDIAENSSREEAVITENSSQEEAVLAECSSQEETAIAECSSPDETDITENRSPKEAVSEGTVSVSEIADSVHDIPAGEAGSNQVKDHFSSHLWCGAPCYRTEPFRTYSGKTQTSKIRPSAIWLRTRMTRLWTRRFY